LRPPRARFDFALVQFPSFYSAVSMYLITNNSYSGPAASLRRTSSLSCKAQRRVINPPRQIRTIHRYLLRTHSSPCFRKCSSVSSRDRKAQAKHRKQCVFMYRILLCSYLVSNRSPLVCESMGCFLFYGSQVARSVRVRPLAQEFRVPTRCHVPHRT
jgi:hypothetical protein